MGILYEKSDDGKVKFNKRNVFFLFFLMGLGFLLFDKFTHPGCGLLHYLMRFVLFLLILPLFFKSQERNAEYRTVKRCAGKEKIVFDGKKFIDKNTYFPLIPIFGFIFVVIFFVKEEAITSFMESNPEKFLAILLGILVVSLILYNIYKFKKRKRGIAINFDGDEIKKE